MSNLQAALGQSPSFVGADYADAADILDDYSATDERLPSCEAIDADAKEEGKDNGKFFWQRGDRQGHGAEDR